MNKSMFRKILLALILSLFFQNGVKSQYFSGGILIGFTGSQLDGDQMVGYNKFGFSGGMFVRRQLNEKYAILGEIKYIMKGSAKNDSLALNSFKISLSYFEIPILLNYRFLKKLEGEAGFAAAYLANATRVLAEGDFQDNSINKLDFSYVIGLNYLVTEKFRLNLKFSHSVQKVSFNLPTNITFFGPNGGQFNNVLEFVVKLTL